MRAPTRLSVAVTIGVVAAAVGVVPATAAPIAKAYANCAAINQVYDGGIAKPGVKYNVVVSGGKSTKRELVGNVKFSKDLYNANQKSDRDRDGIACERS